MNEWAAALIDRNACDRWNLGNDDQQGCRIDESGDYRMTEQVDKPAQVTRPKSEQNQTNLQTQDARNHEMSITVTRRVLCDSGSHQQSGDGYWANNEMS